MNNYNFSTLNDKEFEQISKDLLNAKFNLELQDFKVGKDKGTDLRFSSTNNNNSIVVQVKHYIGSAFAQLKHTLSVKELHKVKNLKPDKYIVVTSLPLSASQKDELKHLLSPFVRTSNDIIGQEDLNSYLSEFKEIEKRYFKLWFSSINVFNAIINNAIEGRTKYLMETIKDKIRFYVIPHKKEDANRILQKEKLLLITGQPGIGKTTLAEILLFEKAQSGHKIYKVENITEAEKVISLDTEEKQLFYFDDFLGANYYEIINAHKTETQLTSFVERVKNTKNKYLILTTRTVIFNQAIEKCEKISRSNLTAQQFEIKITDYTQYEKALILYNHLYFKGVKKDLYNCILEKQFYKTIIQHKNYMPRIIEFITDKSRIETFLPKEYIKFINNHLSNPKEIWRHSFNNQIDYLDRCLLLTLFTFEKSALEKALVLSFENRLHYEKKEHNQIINTNQFNESVKILLNGFIASNLQERNLSTRDYSFINPSLTDFLIGYVSESFQERKSIISSLTYVEQLDRFNPQKSLLPLEKELQLIIRDRIEKSKVGILEESNNYFTKNHHHAVFLEVLCKYCREVNIDSLLLKHFKPLDFNEDWDPIFSKLQYVLWHLEDAPHTFNYIKENFIYIMEKMMLSINEPDLAKEIPSYFEKYEQDYDEYLKSKEGFENVIRVIESVLQREEDSLTSDKKHYVESVDEILPLYDDIYALESELKDILLPNISFDYDFGVHIDTGYWNNLIEDNYFESRLRLYDDEDTNFQEVRGGNYNEDSRINDLFNTSDMICSQIMEYK